MEKDFSVTILTPEKKIYEGRAVSLIAPCETGYWGFLSNHAPFAASTVSGEIILREKTGESRVIHSVSKGFLEVLDNNVTMLL